MPRPARIEYPGAHYHVLCRGNNRQEIFLTDEGRRLFLATLGEVCEQTGWRVHAYCLMSNHYHFSLETPEANLISGMTWFQGSYSQRFNAMFHRCGHLFQGRYKAIPVQTDPRMGGLEYFRKLSTYIHLNPFRAGICGVGKDKTLESYRWSSYPAYCGKVRKLPNWLERNKVYATWGLREEDASAGMAYQQKLEREMKFKQDPEAGAHGEFEPGLKRGWFLGSKLFGEQLLAQLESREGSRALGGQQKRDHNERMAEKLLKSALESLKILEEELLAMKASQEEKQAVAWLLKSNTTVTGVWLADRLKLGHSSNVSRSLRAFREGKTREVKKLKQKMTKCKA